MFIVGLLFVVGRRFSAYDGCFLDSRRFASCEGCFLDSWRFSTCDGCFLGSRRVTLDALLSQVASYSTVTENTQSALDEIRML